MPRFNSRSLLVHCQEGFLLLEMLIAIFAGMVLVGSVAQWYISYAQVQGAAHRRLRALGVLSRYVATIQSGYRAIPQSGEIRIDEQLIRVITRSDSHNGSFWWIDARIEKEGLALVAGIPPHR